MDQIEQAIDNHGLKAIVLQQVDQAEASPGQLKYVQILSEYERELNKLNANP
tara:strand:- start:102 stop:257 length:156 start_codon:yes stop_codon:yes gene_type:complete